MKGDRLETLKFAKKSHTKPKEHAKKCGKRGDSNPRPSAWQTSKNPN